MLLDYVVKMKDVAPDKLMTRFTREGGGGEREKERKKEGHFQWGVSLRGRIVIELWFGALASFVLGTERK
jgi:hypothetical protein